MPSFWRFFVFSLLSFTTFLRLALAADSQQQLPIGTSSSQEDRRYKYSDPIPVSCLNRTIDTGEHVEDDRGRLQYIPFPTCNETGRPLELYFGVEKGELFALSFHIRLVYFQDSASSLNLS